MSFDKVLVVSAAAVLCTLIAAFTTYKIIIDMYKSDRVLCVEAVENHCYWESDDADKMGRCIDKACGSLP